MACKNCSKIRCKLMGLVSGLTSKFNEEYYCGDIGAACILGTHEYEFDFGSTFKSFPKYIRTVGQVLIMRLKGASKYAIHQHIYYAY